MNQCNACLLFSDCWGENICSMQCQLEEGHDGPHIEAGDGYGKPYVVAWFGDNLPAETGDFYTWAEFEERLKR